MVAPLSPIIGVMYKKGKPLSARTESGFSSGRSVIQSKTGDYVKAEYVSIVYFLIALQLLVFFNLSDLDVYTYCACYSPQFFNMFRANVRLIASWPCVFEYPWIFALHYATSAS